MSDIILKGQSLGSLKRRAETEWDGAEVTSVFVFPPKDNTTSTSERFRQETGFMKHRVSVATTFCSCINTAMGNAETGEYDCFLIHTPVHIESEHLIH